MRSYEKYLTLIEAQINSSLPGAARYCDDLPAMLAYSLESGGKRIRPLLTALFCEAAGGEISKALPGAAAVEFVHTYSLIHDDLPCMDNDDYRRGKLSSHKKFGEANALLAGDALLTHAFRILSDAANKQIISCDTACKSISELAYFAGTNGMIGGQYLDLKYENAKTDKDIILTTDALKTSALIAAACLLGLYAAEADDTAINAAKEFAYNLGIAFQLKDDLIEYDEGDTGDTDNGKTTYISLMGAAAAREAAAEYTAKAKSALKVFGEKSAALLALADELLNRKK